MKAMVIGMVLIWMTIMLLVVGRALGNAPGHPPMPPPSYGQDDHHEPAGLKGGEWLLAAMAGMYLYGRKRIFAGRRMKSPGKKSKKEDIKKPEASATSGSVENTGLEPVTS